MPAFPCPFSGGQRLQLCADGCMCVYIIAMSCVGKGVDRQEVGFVLYACVFREAKVVLPFIAIVLGHCKLGMGIWSPPEKVGSRGSGTALGAYRDNIACKVCL